MKKKIFYIIINFFYNNQKEIYDNLGIHAVIIYFTLCLLIVFIGIVCIMFFIKIVCIMVFHTNC